MHIRGTRRPAGKPVRGFSLIELMVALLLGLLVLGAAVGIFVSNRQVYSATEGLGRIQENVRFAFELMARDIREAGGNPCGNHIPLVNVVNASSSNWWTDLNSYEDAASGELVSPWRYTLIGFSDGGPASGAGNGQRVPGTQSIRLLSADDVMHSIQSHNAVASTFTLKSAADGLQAGNLAVVCDVRQASMFQVSSVAGAVVGHAAVGSPGNCTGNLGLPPPVGGSCAGVGAYTYPANAVLARLNASQWYVGNNDRGGRSLYQGRLDAAGTGVTNQEVVDGVEQIAFEYLLDGAGDYVPAGHASLSAAAWGSVLAVRVVVTIESETAAGSTDGAPLARTVSHVVNLRSRTS